MRHNERHLLSEEAVAEFVVTYLLQFFLEGVVSLYPAVEGLQGGGAVAAGAVELC